MLIYINKNRLERLKLSYSKSRLVFCYLHLN